MLYVVMFFLVFFNLFAFLFSYIPIFKGSFEGDETWGVDTEGNTTGSNTLFENLTSFDVGSVFSLFVFDINSPDIIGLIVSGLTLTGAIALAFITHSPAPLVVGFIANFIFNLYNQSTGIFEQMPVNGVMMTVCVVGMFLLFVVTAAETLTHGDA